MVWTYYMTLSSHLGTNIFHQLIKKESHTNARKWGWNVHGEIFKTIESSMIPQVINASLNLQWSDNAYQNAQLQIIWIICLLAVELNVMTCHCRVIRTSWSIQNSSSTRAFLSEERMNFSKYAPYHLMLF